MFVPRRPNSSGNKYHSIGDDDQEGKYHPKNDNDWRFYPSEFENHSMTAALMLEMTRPIHNTCKVVTMDSCCCVALKILSLHNAVVFGHSLITK
ncbi:hypothetical protein ACHAXS_000978 [Conticribra weissflogii]